MSESATSTPAAPSLSRAVRMSGDARRRQLLEQAIHLFATLGFRGTTTRAIARAAGVSEAVIFRHFATKDDLYKAILKLKAHADDLDETIAALKRHDARGEDERLVSRLVRHILDSHRRDPDFQRMMLFAAVEGHDLAKAGATYGVPLFGFLREYVVARQRAGVFRRGDAGLMAFAMVALPVHYLIVAQLFCVEAGCASDCQMAEEFTNLILGGLRCERRSRNRPGQGKARTRDHS